MKIQQKYILFTLALSTAFIWNGRSSTAQEPPSLNRVKPIRKTADQATKFLRLTRDNSGIPQSLQTSITRFRSQDGKLLVDLIAVIHVGERNYYRQLEHQFTQYETLLFELVAPKDSRVPNGSGREAGGNPIRWIQDSMQQMLGLHSQLDHIDYTKSNFVHADLSPSEIKRKMEERGETAWTIGMKAVTEIMREQDNANRNGAANLGSEVANLEDLIDVISNPAKLKTMLATQFASGGAMETGLGSTLNQLLITDRNQAAMKVLKQELDNGKTTIGIFYGAAHMPDFEQRLIADFGMKKTQQAWANAWDLKKAPPTASPASTLSDMFFRLLDDLDQ